MLWSGRASSRGRRRASRLTSSVLSGVLVAGTVVGASTLQVASAPPALAATSNNYCGGVGSWNGTDCVFESQSDGSWTKPSWVGSYDVTLVGGGGGGAAVYSTSGTSEPQWGSAGKRGDRLDVSSTSSPITFTIGSGGTGSPVYGTAATAGGSTTVPGLGSAAGGGAPSDGNWWNCTSQNPATFTPVAWSVTGRSAQAGPLSGKNWGESGWGGIAQNNGSCPTNGGPTSSAGQSGQSGGIRILFAAAPTPSAPTSVTASSDPTNASLGIAFSGAGNFGGLTPEYRAQCVPGSGSTLTSPWEPSSPITIPSATRGQTYTCTVQTRTLGGESSYSTASSSVLVAGAPWNTAIPVVSGMARVAGTLSTTDGTWGTVGSITGTEYQWQSSLNGTTGWTNIPTATGSSYVVSASLAGQYVRSTVRKQNSFGWSSWAESTATALVPGALHTIQVTTQPVAGAVAGSLLATQPVVTLVDASGTVIDDRSLTVTVSIDGGTAGGVVGGTTSVTTSTGIATFSDLTFGGRLTAPGPNYRLRFTSSPVTGTVTATSDLISSTTAGAPTQLAVLNQPTITSQTVGSEFTQQPSIRILDASGNLTTSTATVTATPSGGTLGGTTSITAIAGTATFSGLTFAGLISTNYQLTFSSPGLTSATSANFNFANASQVGAASLTTSTVTASSTSLRANGTDTSTVTVQIKDIGGNNITASQGSIPAPGTVALSTTQGALSAVSGGDGTYTATFTAPAERGSGTALITATLNGSALSDTESIAVFTTQTITFAQPVNRVLGALPFAVEATASSGLAVTYSSPSGSVCTVTAGGFVTILMTGSCQVDADQPGDTVYWRAPQVSRTFSVAATTPTAPYITSVTEGNTEATVAFEPPGFDGGASITNYQYSLDGGENWTSLSPVDASTPVTIPSLTNLTAYRVSLRAVNSAGPGLASSASPTFTPKASGGTTVTASTTTPLAPRNPETLSQAAGAVTVSWQEPQSNGGATITSYTVEVDPSGTCTASIASASRNGSCTIAGLVPGRTYTFTIRAVNSNGAGAAAVISYLVPGGPGPAPNVTLTLDPNGGTCTIGSISGPATSWSALPTASDCRRQGSLLVGWQPLHSMVLYAPGRQVQLIENNTLRAAWLTSSGAEAPSAVDSRPHGKVRWVVWSSDGKHVRAGRPAAMHGHHPVVTIVTKDSSVVTKREISVARSIAREHQGVYAGVVRANWWNRPRIVAAYIAAPEVTQ